MILKIRATVIYRYVPKPETKRDLLAVLFYSGLLAVSFYLLVRAVPYKNCFVSFWGFYYIPKTLALIIPPLRVLNTPAKVIGI